MNWKIICFVLAWLICGVALIRGMEVKEKSREIIVRNGPLSLTIEKTTAGFLTEVRMGDKLLVTNRMDVPIRLSLVKADAPGGRTIPVDGILETARFGKPKVKVQRGDNQVTIVSKGKLITDKFGEYPYEMSWQITEGSPVIRWQGSFQWGGKADTDFVRQMSLHIPLALNARKRVVQGGDRGIHFDSRYTYDFTIDTRMMVLATNLMDHNEWNLFAVSQDAPNHFRMWKAESEATASLTMQEGKEAAGWIGAYDRQGGIVMGYAGLAEQAPKCLQVNAGGGGELVLMLHPPYSRPLDQRAGADPQHVFGIKHEMLLVFHEKEFPEAHPDQALCKEWKLPRLASDLPVKPYPPAPAVDIPYAEGSTAPLVNGGVPLPQGAITQADQVRLMKGEKEVPLQTRILAYWPDHSVKWLLLTFPPDGSGGYVLEAGQGAGQTIPVNVTTRRQETNTFRLCFGKDVKTGRITSPLTVKNPPGGTTNEVIIDTGKMQMLVRDFIRQVVVNGKTVVSDQPGRRNFMDFVWPATNYPVNTSGCIGERDEGEAEVESIEVEEAGPLKAVIAIRGKYKNREAHRMALRLEAYAGRAYVRIYHSVVFMQADPRKCFMNAMGLRLPLQVTGTKTRVMVGGEGEPVELKGGLTGISQPSYLDYQAWQLPAETGPCLTVQRGEKSQGWLDVSDGEKGCGVVIRNMWQKYPKAMTYNQAKGMLTAYLWPEDGNVCDVRRYSARPHRSQGESIFRAGKSLESWADEVYYNIKDHAAFRGVSITHELVFIFHEGDAVTTQVRRVAADVQSPALIYVTPEWYRDTGITAPYALASDSKCPQLEADVSRVFDFMLCHRDFWGWYGMFNYGDFRHAFNHGYGWIIQDEAPKAQAPGKTNEVAVKSEPAARKVWKPGERVPQANRQLDYYAQHGWSYDNGRWGWCNTEGLESLALSFQYLRTGRRDLYFASEAMACQNRDVITRHAGKFFGCGTRHGVQPWSDGNHEPRQTVNSEFRFYYYLSGDRRCEDVNRALTDNSYMQGVCGDAASHSARLYGIFMRWEMTGDRKYYCALSNYIHALIVPEGIAIHTPVQFPEGVRAGPPAGTNELNMFFTSFGAGHALREYEYLTHDADLRNAMGKWADIVIKSGGSYLSYPVLTVAARDNAAPERYISAMSNTLAGGAPSTVAVNPDHWLGPRSYLCHNNVVPGQVPGQDIVSVFWWLNEAPYVMRYLSGDPVVSEAQKKKIENRQQNGWPTNTTRRESWQDDIPVLKP
jgi:hypothetical protein